MMSCPSRCPKCNVLLKALSLNSLRAHLNRVHGLSAEQAWLLFREHPGPCVQCSGAVKFLSFQSGYERLCGRCNKTNSQLRGAANRKKKKLKAWNRGLTEETSDAVKRAAQGCRNFIQAHGHWRTGQTKENNESVARAANSISRTLKEKWESEKHWTQHGNTAETDERIKRRSLNISAGVKANHWSRSGSAADIKRTIIETRKKLIANGTNSPFRLTEATINARLDRIRQDWHVIGFEFRGHKSPVDVACPTCDYRNTHALDILYKGKVCPRCYPRNFSRWHQDLYAEFLTLDPGATVNDRTLIAPFELDIVSSNRQFAIECNGLYWHSEAFETPPSYHQEKTDRAMAAKIALFHVFEDEWRDVCKRSIIKSMMKVKLNLARRVMARKLELHGGHPANVANFLRENHLDGNTPASKAFWLVDDSKNIMCALTLRRPHQQAKWGNKTIELARVATLRDFTVVGGMSRLIKAATVWARSHGYERVITYRDMRLGGSGHGYEASGFVKSHVTAPRFWWTDCNHRIDRFAVRSIPDIATQDELAMEHRLFKIYGCSNVVYVLDL